MKKNILLLALVFLLFSCKNESKVNPELPKDDNTIETLESATISIIDTAYNESNTIDDYCAALEYLENDYTVKLQKKNTLEDNNALYEKYVTIRNAYINNLTNSQDPLLIKYVNFYNEEQEDYVLDDAFTKIANQLKKVGIEFWYLGEGYTEFRSIPTHELKLFKGKVSADYQEFISQIAAEDKVLYSSDGGLLVSFDEVGSRVAFWEQFLTKYPHSKLENRAKQLYTNYLSDFIFGLENTQTYTDALPIIDPVYLEVYDSFAKKFPNLKATKKIEEFRKLAAKKATIDEIHATLNLK